MSYTPSRRSFLARSALAAAPLLAAPAVFAKAAPRRAGANSRIGLGMIGVGRQAMYANLPPFLHHADVQVVAVCDVDAWRLARAKEAVEKHYAKEAAAGTYAGCAATKDYRELLARADVDAVMISTPDHWHVPMAIAAAKAGKDVAAEKPLIHSLAEGRELADTVARYGRVFRTDTEVRSTAVFHKAAEVVRSGRIGKLLRIQTGVPRGDKPGGVADPMPVPEELDYDAWLGPAPLKPYTLDRVHPRRGYGRPGWMRCRDTCFGMVTNWGTHLNDIALWGADLERTGPVEVQGTGTFASGGLWDVLTDFDLRYTFANGVELHYTVERPFVRFEGTDGWVRADWFPNSLKASNESILRDPPRPGDVRFPLKSEKDDFIDCVKTRGRTLIDAEVGHRATALGHLGHIAIELGRKLRWDPAAEKFVADDAANRLLSRPVRAGFET